MSNIDWVSTSLRISSSKLTTSEISKVLNLEPLIHYKKGELMSSRNPKSQKFKENLCIYENIAKKSDDLEMHLKKIGLFIKNNENKLKELITNCEIDVYCGISYNGGQGGIVLNSEILKKLASIPIEIIFDLYFEEDEDT